MDANVLSILWEVVVCNVHATSEAAFWDDVRVPTNCEPFEKALDVYIDEYVQFQSTVHAGGWTWTSVCHSRMDFSPSRPILSFTPYSELISQKLE